MLRKDAEHTTQADTSHNAYYGKSCSLYRKWDLRVSRKIRHFALFWPQALAGEPAYKRRPTTFPKTVKRLMKIVRRRGVPKALQQQCQVAWSTAIGLDEARVQLSSGAAVPEGLVIFDERDRGNAPIASEVRRLLELNEKTIALAKDLQRLLSELQRLPAFSTQGIGTAA